MAVKLDWETFLRKFNKKSPFELLNYLYHEEGKSLMDIALMFNVSQNFVSKTMENLGIKRRSISESRKLKNIKSGHIGRGDLKNESVK